MRNFKKIKKGNPRQPVFLYILLGSLLLFVVGFLVVSNLRIGQKRSDLNARIESLREEIQALETRNQQLRAESSQVLKEGYLEKEARERFNLKKPGEEVVTILPPEEKEESSEEEEKIWWTPLEVLLRKIF